MGVLSSGEGLIAGKIVAILRDASAVAKDQVNKDQGFNFRGVDAVVNAVSPLLKKHGVVVMPIRVDELGGGIERFENANKKIVTDANLAVTYRWIAEDGSYLDTQTVGAGRDFADKAVAKAMSVAFRTLLLQSLALPTDDRDPDSESIEVEAPAAAPVAASGPSVADLQSKIKGWVSAQSVTNAATGEVAPVSAAEIDAVGRRIAGVKDSTWKTNGSVLAKVIAAVEAGERK